MHKHNRQIEIEIAPLSSSPTYMSLYFLTASAILPLTIYQHTASVEFVLFLINFLHQRQKSSKDAAAITAFAAATCGNLAAKKVSVETTVYFKSLKAKQEMCFIRIFETVLVWCNMFVHDRGAEGKKFKSTSKTFPLPPFVHVDFRL